MRMYDEIAAGTIVVERSFSSICLHACNYIQITPRDYGGVHMALIVPNQTIPYGKDIVAKIVLTCDCRGCMALPAKAMASYRTGEEDGGE